MNTFLRFRSVLCFALLTTFLLSSQSISQDNNFVGVQRIKEGKNIMFKTVPVEDKSGAVSSSLPNALITNKDKYALGGNVLWSFQDPASIGNIARLSGDGKFASVGWTLNQMRASYYSDDSSTPLWEFSTGTSDPTVAISDDGTINAVSSGTDFYLLDKVTGQQVYHLQMPDTFYISNMNVSRNGKLIVLLAEPVGNNKTARIICINTTQSVPYIRWTYEVNKSVITNWTGVRFSITGNNLVVNGRNHLFVFDTTGVKKWDTFVDNSEAPAVISGDGRVIVTADNSGFVKTYNSTDGSQFSLLWQFKIPLTSAYTNWASSCAISADGRIILAGSLDWTNGGSSFDGTIFAFDTYGGGIPKWTHTGCGDMVDDISISDNGKVAAAASWGDLAQAKSDLYVFDVETGQITFEINSPGSFFTVDVSHDGTRVITGGKAVHARAFGMGGLIYFSSIDLGGGNISGTVNITGTDKSGVLVEVAGLNRSTLTASDGSYVIKNVPAGTYTVKASKPGFNYGSVANVVVTEANTTSNINFTLASFTTQPPVLSATTTLVKVIRLNFTGLLTQRMRNEIAKAVGDPYTEESINGIISFKDKEANLPTNDLLYSLADSIAIYRSVVPGGPYNKVGATLRTSTSYTDSSVYPLKNYYYVVNVFNTTGQSTYSNEVSGKVSDTLMTFSFTAPQGSVPSIDGVISEGEWSDAYKVDVSDVLGYSGSNPKPQGSVYMYFKFDNTTKMLYIAGEDFLNPTLDDGEGFGLYFDDNNNNQYEPQSALPILQEGNYWAYYYSTGANVRFRKLFTGGGAGTVDTLFDALVKFSQSSGHVTGEVAIPMGFSRGNQLHIFGPDKTPGLGAFMTSKPSGNTVFDGWWPQTMNSLFNPQYFGDIKINTTLVAPPNVPAFTVSKDKRDLVVNWTDPLGLNNDPLPYPPKIRLYKDSQYLKTFNAGVQTFKDTAVECPNWYEYQMDAYMVMGTDTLYGPLSQPFGDFACKTPEMTHLLYDDNIFNGFFIVTNTFEDNKFAVRCTPTFYPARVLRLQTLTNGAGFFDFTVNADSSGTPGKVVAGPYRVSSGVAGDASQVIKTLPGNEPPYITDGDFWVVVNYLPTSPTDPGIGVDITPPLNQRSMYYMSSTGWTSMAQYNLMISAYIADTALFVGVKDPINNMQPLAYDLLQNYPNPFNPTTTIYYQLPETQLVTLEVFNSLGQKIATLVNNVENAGKHSIIWNGKNEMNSPVSSGMYMYRIKAGNYVQSRKMLLMK